MFSFNLSTYQNQLRPYRSARERLKLLFRNKVNKSLYKPGVSKGFSRLALVPKLYLGVLSCKALSDFGTLYSLGARNSRT